MLKNKKTIIIFLIIIAVILIILRVITYDSNPKKIEKFLISQNFTKDSNSSLYTKQISDINLDKYNINLENKKESTYEELIFNTDNYQLTKTKMVYSSELAYTFTPTYDFTSDKLSYFYRVTYNDANVIAEGSYSEENFVCDIIYAYSIDIEEQEEIICGKLRLYLEDFDYEVKTLITNHKLLEFMRKQ